MNKDNDNTQFFVLGVAVVVYIVSLAWMAVSMVDGGLITNVGTGGLIALALLYWLIRDKK